MANSLLAPKQERSAMTEKKWQELTTPKVDEVMDGSMTVHDAIARMPSAKDKARWTTLVFASTGSNGGGKSLFLTVHQTEQLIKAHFNGFHVWSNYRVGFYYRCPIHQRMCFLHSDPLDMTALYTFDKGLAWGWVYIDEVDKWMDCQEWADATQKLTNKILTLIRHRQLSLGLTIQQLDWLNNRFKFQVDAEFGCRDASFTPWGKGIGLNKGEVNNLTARDYTGKLTGFMYNETGRVYTMDMRAKWAWQNYDTFEEFDPNVTAVKYKIEKREKMITTDGQIIDISAMRQAKAERMGQVTPQIEAMILSLKNEGYERIDKTELRAKLYEKGIQLDYIELGKILSSLNVGVKKEKYDLTYAM